jgi:hypothetical protein
MQRLEVSCAVRPIYGLSVKGLRFKNLDMFRVLLAHLEEMLRKWKFGDYCCVLL